MRIAKDTVRQGENIVTLTSRLTGDPLQWSAIARLNNLKAPYIAEDSLPYTLSVGDTVLYPAPDLPAATLNPSQLIVNTYKRDWAASKGDLTLSAAGQITTQAGLDNLRTAITRRLTTLRGQHPFHPDYGSLVPLHVGELMDAGRARLIVVDARRAIMRDPRVEDCSVNVDWKHEILSLDILITPIAPGSPFRMTVNF